MVSVYDRGRRRACGAAGLLLPVILASLLLALPASAQSPPSVRVPVMPPEAPFSEDELSDRKRRVRKLARRAKSDLSRGRSEAALEKADRMLAILPQARTALFRADILRDLGRVCEAFDSVLVAADLQPLPNEKLEIALKLADDGPRCGEGMGYAIFFVEPEKAAAKADLYVSGTRVPPRRTVGLAAGSHDVEISAPGYRPLKERIRIVAGEEIPALFELAWLPVVAVPAPPPDLAEPPPGPGEAAAGPPPSPPPAEATIAEPAPSTSPRRIWAWSLAGGGAALAAAGVVFHVKAFGSLSDADDLTAEARRLRSEQPEGWADSYVDVRERHEGAISDAGTSQTVAMVFYGAALAAAGTGVALFLLEPSAEPASFGLLPTLSRAGPGLSLRGGF